MAVAVRIAVGALADRGRGDYLVGVMVMMVIGSVGWGLLSVSGEGFEFVILGSMAAFGAGWGWSGLFTVAIVRRNPGCPARATGITQAGIFLGGAIGPAGFGVVARGASMGMAWLAAAALALVGAACVGIGGGYGLRWDRGATRRDRGRAGLYGRLDEG